MGVISPDVVNPICVEIAVIRQHALRRRDRERRPEHIKTGVVARERDSIHLDLRRGAEVRPERSPHSADIFY